MLKGRGIALKRSKNRVILTDRQLEALTLTVGSLEHHDCIDAAEKMGVRTFDAYALMIRAMQNIKTARSSEARLARGF